MLNKKSIFPRAFEYLIILIHILNIRVSKFIISININNYQNFFLKNIGCEICYIYPKYPKNMTAVLIRYNSKLSII